MGKWKRIFEQSGMSFKNSNNVIVPGQNYKVSPFKNKFMWITTALLFILTVFSSLVFISAKTGGFTNNIFGARIFGMAYFLLSVCLGIFLYFANRWNNVKISFWINFFPFIILFGLSVVSVGFLFFFLPFVLMFMGTLFKLYFPFLIGFVCASWVFSDLSDVEIYNIKTAYQNKKNFSRVSYNEKMYQQQAYKQQENQLPLYNQQKFNDEFGF